MEATATHRLLAELSTDEFFDTKNEIRASFDADTMDGFTFVKSLSPGRYAVRFHGISVGWVWKDAAGWSAWQVCTGHNDSRRLTDGERTRANAAEEIRNSIAIYGFNR